MKPWTCPECRTVYAPWVDRCLCIRNIAKANPADLPRDYNPAYVNSDRLCACGHAEWLHSPVHKACPIPGCNCGAFKVNTEPGRRCVRCNHSDHAHLNVDGGSCQIVGCGCTDGLWVR